METIDFNEVIRDPETISVVGGLLPEASAEKKGLKPNYEANILNINIATINSGKYTKIVVNHVDVTLIWKRTQYNNIPEIILISRGNANGKPSSVGIVTRFNVKNMSEPNIYIDKNGNIYLQVEFSAHTYNCICNFLNKSPIQYENDVDLPSDAVKIEVKTI